MHSVCINCLSPVCVALSWTIWPRNHSGCGQEMGEDRIHVHEMPYPYGSMWSSQTRSRRNPELSGPAGLIPTPLNMPMCVHHLAHTHTANPPSSVRSPTGWAKVMYARFCTFVTYQCAKHTCLYIGLYTTKKKAGTLEGKGTSLGTWWLKRFVRQWG